MSVSYRQLMSALENHAGKEGVFALIFPPGMPGVGRQDQTSVDVYDLTRRPDAPEPTDWADSDTSPECAEDACKGMQIESATVTYCADNAYAPYEEGGTRTAIMDDPKRDALVYHYSANPWETISSAQEAVDNGLVDSLSFFEWVLTADGWLLACWPGFD
jgi:hypothetical protein